MKAAHIRKVRDRIERAQAILLDGAEPEGHEAWTDRMAGLIAGVRKDRLTSRKSRQAAASAIWMLFFSDMPGVCDALIEANQLIAQQRRQIGALHVALREHGIELDKLPSSSDD
jgi:hypothetical protein